MHATHVFTILLLLNFLKKMHNIIQYENQLKAGQIVQQNPNLVSSL